MTSLLEVESVEVRYGDFVAVTDVSLRIEQGETLALIGANGAGKSTLLKAISGLEPLASGQISLDGKSLDGQAAHRRVRMGISLMPEGRRVFPSLTVEENLLVGAYARRPGPWDLKSVYALFPLLEERRQRFGAHLSGGEQQAVAIGRGLMSNPRLLLLDELSLGLAPVVIGQIYQSLPAITAKGTTVLVVEQDLGQALRVAARIQCLLGGRTVLEKPAAEVTRAQVAAAYFGI